MESNETPLEVAQRRVAEAQAHVNAQIARVADLARRGLDTTQAKATFAVFETTLRIMREDLAREQERAAGNQQ
jgi:DNA-binding phage protein